MRVEGKFPEDKLEKEKEEPRLRLEASGCEVLWRLVTQGTSLFSLPVKFFFMKPFCWDTYRGNTAGWICVCVCIFYMCSQSIDFSNKLHSSGTLQRCHLRRYAMASINTKGQAVQCKHTVQANGHVYFFISFFLPYFYGWVEVIILKIPFALSSCSHFLHDQKGVLLSTFPSSTIT